jgi:hypothetical protein
MVCQLTERMWTRKREHADNSPVKTTRYGGDSMISRFTCSAVMLGVVVLASCQLASADSFHFIASRDLPIYDQAFSMSSDNAQHEKSWTLRRGGLLDVVCKMAVSSPDDVLGMIPPEWFYWITSSSGTGYIAANEIGDIRAATNNTTINTNQIPICKGSS